MDTQNPPQRDNAVGEFLRARRELVRPEQVGLPNNERRRVPGLRREEVALLAGVSTDYYMRMEQGRERNPSRQIIDAVAGALRLDDDALAHLYRLVRPASRRKRRSRTQSVSPQLLRLLDGWHGTPAFIVGHALDVLAFNPLAAALYSEFSRPCNLLWMTFLDPARSAFYRDWNRSARAAVAELRVAAGKDPDDPRLTELVGQLSMKSPIFRELWASHEVHGKTREAKRFHHAQVGHLELHYEAFTINSTPEQQLVVYQADPDTPSADALALLGTLAAESLRRSKPAHDSPPAPA